MHDISFGSGPEVTDKRAIHFDGNGAGSDGQTLYTQIGKEILGAFTPLIILVWLHCIERTIPGLSR